MTADSIITKARTMFLTDYERELKENGILPPSVNKSPIYPPWTEVEYQAMEKDTAKYFLYYSAINMAIKDMKHRNDKITCLVIGPGRGRLIEFCLDCLDVNKIDGVVHVMECNVKAIKLLTERYERHKDVILHPAVVIRDYDEIKELFQRMHPEQHMQHSLKTLYEKKCVDIFVSELFGSFGDNEFMPEILDACVQAFGSENSISIPEKCVNYLTPIHSQTLASYFEKGASKDSDFEKVFVLGLPEDTAGFSSAQKMYSYNCKGNKVTLNGEIEFFHCLCSSVVPSKVSKSAEDVDIHMETFEDNHEVLGFAGHFKAVLYKDIYIDTRPGPTRNTYFWESAFFPLNRRAREAMKTLCSGCRAGEDSTSHGVTSRKGICLRLELKRMIQKLERCKEFLNTRGDSVNTRDAALYKLWYEWTIISKKDEIIAVHNTNGGNHAFFL